MTRLTRELIRKKAEHHEGILPDLEEISLHQLELERIEVVGDICRKIQILYLQNNIIPKIENLSHCKDLQYLNVALNNIERIEGLRTCEFLNKLDLTVNFIDLDTFEESIAELRHNRQLRDLYLMGNPCTDWDGCREFVAAVLGQLEQLDGKAITRTERIVAQQKLPLLLKELRLKAQQVRIKKIQEKGLPYDENEYTSESRREMYLEQAAEKKEKEDREKAMRPRERNKEKEHTESVQKAREKEQNQIKTHNTIRQCNEGRYDFKMLDDDGNGNVVVEVEIPRFIDTSLVDVDVQPNHVSIVIKNKTLRLRFEDNVRPDAGKAERSKITGCLKLTLPKVDTSKVLRTRKLMEQQKKEALERIEAEKLERELSKKKTVSTQLLMSAEEAAKANVGWKTIVKDEKLKSEETKEASSSNGVKQRIKTEDLYSSPMVDDSEAPPLE
jgi:protein TilB